jgi:hypothetical protein
MLKNTTYKLLAIALYSFTLSSCGGDTSLGGNVTEFKASIATASAATPRLEADLVKGNTCTTGSSAGGTIITESVDFTIIATKSSSASSLPLNITGYTVTFTPKQVGIPALGQLTNTFSTSVNPSGSVTIPVAIITDKMKVDLITANPALACSLSIYQYDVAVSFHAVEIGTGVAKDISAGMLLAIADRS